MRPVRIRRAARAPTGGAFVVLAAMTRRLAAHCRRISPRRRRRRRAAARGAAAAPLDRDACAYGCVPAAEVALLRVFLGSPSDHARAMAGMGARNVALCTRRGAGRCGRCPARSSLPQRWRPLQRGWPRTSGKREKRC
jgi:hypothetical protein